MNIFFAEVIRMWYFSLLTSNQYLHVAQIALMNQHKTMSRMMYRTNQKRQTSMPSITLSALTPNCPTSHLLSETIYSEFYTRGWVLKVLTMSAAACVCLEMYQDQKNFQYSSVLSVQLGGLDITVCICSAHFDNDILSCSLSLLAWGPMDWHFIHVIQNY